MPPIVTLPQGRLRGQERDGVSRFLGIPYAAAPIGPLRFQAPAPHWLGERDATVFAATPPKPRYAEPLDYVLQETDVAGDEWLNVNVWTPAVEGSVPVMVWVHGGGFVNGNNTIPAYDGHNFARDGVVLVSINYRLGVEGFLLLPDAPTNRGLRDQIAALEWVRDNISAFGGDPDNVTVFGESAGAMSILTLLASPRAQGLFHKAITQSGSIQAIAAPGDAALVAARFGAELEIVPSAAALATHDPHDLVAPQRAVAVALATQPDPAVFGQSVVAAQMAYIPVLDGDLVPQHPMVALSAGTGAGIPLLTGVTTEEYRLFLVPTGFAAKVNDDILAHMTTRLGISAAVVDTYRKNRPEAAPGDILAALLTDAYFRLPAYAVAAARAATGAHSWFYEFAEPATEGLLGAAHGMEIGYVFDNLDARYGDRLTGPQPPQGVADEMHAAWIRFARTGDPGWPTFDLSYPVMTFDRAGARVVNDPRGDERAAWSA